MRDLLRAWQQFWCRHDLVLDFERHRLGQKCVTCGYRSPGFDLSSAPPKPRYAKLLRFRRRLAS